MGRALADACRREAELCAAALHVVVLAAVLIPGSTPWSGPVLLALTPTHGVHLTDLGVVALGLAVLVAAWRRGLVRALLLPLAPATP